MAFQCMDCYRNNQMEFMFRSYGPCENCGYTNYCIDAPFDIAPNWKDRLKRTLIAAKIMKPDDDIKNFLLRRVNDVLD